MPRQTVKFEGGRELEAALKELPRATGRSVVRRTLKQAAEPVRRSWQAKAPQLTGQLKGSIIVGIKLTKRQARSVKKAGKSTSEIHIGTSDPAGLMTEFGNMHQAAEPSGRPAWAATQDDALRIIGGELRNQIEKARVRLARKAARAAAKGQ
jgi:HK97 gp10 family phage protein